MKKKKKKKVKLQFQDPLNKQSNSNLKHSFLPIRIYLNNWEKKTLKAIALLCRDKPAEMKYNCKFEQW